MPGNRTVTRVPSRGLPTSSRIHSKATLISSSRVQVPSQARADLLPIRVPAIPAHIIHMGRRAVPPIMQDIMPVPSMRRRVLMARRCRMGQGPILKLPQAF